MTHSVSRAAAAALMIGLLVLISSSRGLAASKCSARANPKDGTVAVSAKDVVGSLMWGTAPGAETAVFDNAATCISGTPAQAKKCLSGASGTLAAQTPPASCTIYLKDDTASCSARVKFCTPGVRLLDASFPAGDPRVVGLSLELVDGQPTLRFTGVNVQVVSGSGTTNGTVNGLGNLIVGYNGNTIGATRTGSHNLVVGDEHTYTNYGGLVAGWQNTISGPSASVSGGLSNIASGPRSSVSGGYQNEASNYEASVSGGVSNLASGQAAAVGGGNLNVAGGDHSSVSGGLSNIASGTRSSVSGGFQNTASGPQAAVSGGSDNEANNYEASVSGGVSNLASGQAASVNGGKLNVASGDHSSVSGGLNRTALGVDDWVAGALFQDF